MDKCRFCRANRNVDVQVKRALSFLVISRKTAAVNSFHILTLITAVISGANSNVDVRVKRALSFLDICTADVNSFHILTLVTAVISLKHPWNQVCNIQGVSEKCSPTMI